ncbi:hypothetical protein J7K24_03305 [bacterium]|nr:hypothetical protein [bacterium]
MFEVATLSGLIRWEKTGEIIDPVGRKLNLYKGKIEEIEIQTDARYKEIEGLLGKRRAFAVCMKIDTGNESMVLTSDPEVIPGVKQDDVWLWATIIDRAVVARNPLDLLAKKLTQLLLAKK